MHSMDSPNSASGIPAFLVKLWRLVEDESTDNLISWNESGNGFIVKNQTFFSKEILPLFFKHNNMASFVRQLNMYGFRKILSIESGGLKPDKDEIEFAHPYFLKDCYFLLENIKRKIPSSKDDTKLKVEVVSKALTDVKVLKSKQDTFDNRLNRMKKENESLWREIANLREKHAKQQQILNRLIQFLVTIVQSNRSLGVKRSYPLMLDEVSHGSSPKQKMTHINVPTNPSSDDSNSLIHDVTDSMEEIDDSCVPSGSNNEPSIILPAGNQPAVLLAPIGQSINCDANIPSISVPVYSYDSDKNSVSKPEFIQIVTDPKDEGVPISIDENGAIKAFGKQLIMPTDHSLKDESPESNPLASILMSPVNENKASTTVIPQDKTANKDLSLQVSLNNIPKPSENTVQEVGKHLETVQLNLDCLKDLLSYPCYGIDSNTLVGVSKGGASLDNFFKIFENNDGLVDIPTENALPPVTDVESAESLLDSDQCQLFSSMSPVPPPDEEHNLFSPLMMNNNSDFDISDSSYMDSPMAILPCTEPELDKCPGLETPKFDIQEIEFPNKKGAKKGKGKKKKIT